MKIVEQEEIRKILQQHAKVILGQDHYNSLYSENMKNHLKGNGKNYNHEGFKLPAT